MSIEIRALGPGDDEMLTNVAAGVFDHSPKVHLTAEFLNDPRHHLVVALDSGKVVGFVSALHYVHPDKSAELWLNEVAVAPTHQNQGVGRSMLQNMFMLGDRLGCRCAWVLTDRANAPAMRLYAASGGVEAPNPSVLFEFELPVAESAPYASSPTDDAA
jgi:ribosomal protein S18 acetylase RimI-like enzyme